MRRFILVVGALCAAVSTGATADAQALEKVKMSIAARAMNYAPYFIPIVKGYFKDEGLDVEIVDAGGGVATPAQISGEIDFNTSASSALSAMLRGAQLRIVYFPWDKTIYQIWATTPEIKTLADVKGKAIGVQTRGDTFEIGVRLSLANHGIDPNSVSYTPLGLNNARRAAIAAGSLPVAAITPEDVEWLKSTNQIKSSHLLYDMYPEIGMPLAGTSVRTADLGQHRDRVKRFLRAVHKGFMYAAAFRPETVEIVSQFAKNSDKEALDLTYKNTIITATKDGTISEKLQRQEAELRAELIKVDKSKIPPLDKLYDFSVAREAWNELVSQGWKPTK
jgi:NitT/TauT family transport system substrate-binding protein